MPPVAVRILHPGPSDASGELGRWVDDARAALAEHQRRAFFAAGADDVEIVTGPPDGRSFGSRLRELVEESRPNALGMTGGLVVLGSGSIPLATAADRGAFVAAAGASGREALANNRYSADVVAIARVETLPEIPDLPGDNALPRWLEEVAGYRVTDLRRRWRLAFDIDGPLDLVLLGATSGAAPDVGLVQARIDAVRAVAADRRAELLVAGRSSPATLAWLERRTAARVRAWVEERGLRAASRLAQGPNEERGDGGGRDDRPGDGARQGRSDPRGARDDRSGRAAGREPASEARPRAPASILGTLLDRDGPGSLGEHLARFADAAIVDTRVLLAHRLGADEAGWPVAEDRFASDLLLPERIADPWLHELTASAVNAPIPVLLGGHTLVGPGVRLVVDGPPAGARWM
jgi:hypothetical protein